MRQGVATALRREYSSGMARVARHRLCV